MTKEQHDERIQELQAKLSKRLPHLGPLLQHLESFTIHQDEIGPELKEENIYLLGLIAKVAGIYGTEIKVVGTCYERFPFDQVPEPESAV